MSMLAERKRKQKWSLNPRGKIWAQDTNKFGQKMLEKMGWTHGKGLGAKEDGMVNHIKVNYKNDSKGMGYKESDNQWTEHESNFTALLEALGEQEFITKSLPVLQVAVETDKEKPKEENDVEDKKVEDNGNFYNKGSMSDYFKKKMPSFGKTNGYVVGNNGVLKKGDGSESESELRPSFGFGFRSSENETAGSNFISYIDENKNEEPVAEKLNKKKKKIVDGSESESELRPGVGLGFKNSKNENGGSNFISYIGENKNDDVTPKKSNKKKRKAEDTDSTPSKKKKTDDRAEVREDTPIKKKKKSKKVESQENGLSNPAFDPLYSPTKVERHYLETIEETFNESLDSTTSQIAEMIEVKADVHNEKTLERYVETGLIVIEDDVDEPKRKKKKSKENNGNSDSASRKKKSKNHTEISVDDVIVINSENENTLSPENENPLKEKKKKKKKSKQDQVTGLENPVFNDESDQSFVITGEEFEVKRKDKSKKKSKKDKKEEIGIDNPALNLNDTVEDCDLMLNIVSTPVSQKTDEKSVNSFSIKRVSEDYSSSRRKSVRFSDVTRERIIPNKEDIHQSSFGEGSDIIEIEGKLNDSAEIPVKKSKKRRMGLENNGFDYQANSIEENITSITNTLDSYEAEIENDMNEAKLKAVELSEIMVGEVGNPDGENEALSDGSVKLKFKYAKFRKQPTYMDALTGPKKSYKHLIKGDILLNFKQSNLHEISGYANKE
ncbi:hypothetical protein GWI33_012998 [Rhynchophorus ferrugineus]|uniref:G-patch domain-containing protein n=1 Tax=Rhynchophorus ferrugineus TaxID=354439 RepID=A0A834IA92_RHYFE|nr:hypothetical protein GWI33_012998 [Rhynchophorus ferrugineus]